MTLQQFKDKYLGKQIEYHSYGTGAFNQCVDLVNQYINEVLDNNTKDYTEIIGTNAKDFSTKYDPEDFDWIVNTPEAIIQEGDIAVWNGRVGGGVGHVGIALNGDANSFQSLDQNWSRKEYVTIETHTYANVLGWLRPKNVQKQVTISQEELDKIRLDRDAHYNDLQKAREDIAKLTQDLQKEQANSKTYLDQLQKITDEEKNTTEQLIVAQKAVQPLQDAISQTKKAAGYDDTLITEKLPQVVKQLYDSKVKYLTPKGIKIGPFTIYLG